MEIIFILTYLAILLHTIGRILYYVKDPSKTLSWLLVVILIPIIGIVLYRLVGRSPRKDKLFQQKSAFYNTQNDDILHESFPASKRRLIELLHKNQSSASSTGNKAQVLIDGAETFKHLFKTLKSAKSTIHLDYYIIEAGSMLDQIINIFRDRIAHGVKIRLVYDGFGTNELDPSHIKTLKEIGVECHEFIPFRVFQIFKFLNYRNHRKIVIVDNRIAFTGGMNISDKYLDGDKKLGLWRDTFIKIEGPAAIDFEKIFQYDWHYAGGKPYKHLKKADHNVENGCAVQVIASGPNSEHKGIMQEYFTIITGAQEYVYITTPYFIPGEALMTALKTSAMSGIDIQIMLPYDSDSRWMKWSMFTFLEELLAAGVRIFLFHEGFLHSKVIISDDIISSVGTANVDERSFEANFEVNAVVYDKKTTLKLKEHFYDDMNSCEELSLSNFPHRSDRNRIMESIARLSSPIL